MTTFQNLKNTAIILTATLPTIGCAAKSNLEQSSLGNSIEASSTGDDIEQLTPPAISSLSELENHFQAPNFTKGKAWIEYNRVEYAFAVSAINFIEELASMLRKDSGAYNLLNSAKEELILATRADDLDTVIDHGTEASMKVQSLFLMLRVGNLSQEYKSNIEVIHKSINGMLRPLLDQRLESSNL